MEREEEGVRETSDVFPLAHLQPGTWAATQACAWTGKCTSDPWVRRPALNPLSHTSRGQCLFLMEGGL